MCTTVDQCLDFNNLETEVLIIQKLEDEKDDSNPTVDFVWNNNVGINDDNKYYVEEETN